MSVSFVVFFTIISFSPLSNLVIIAAFFDGTLFTSPKTFTISITKRRATEIFSNHHLKNPHVLRSLCHWIRWQHPPETPQHLRHLKLVVATASVFKRKRRHGHSHDLWHYGKPLPVFPILRHGVLGNYELWCWILNIATGKCWMYILMGFWKSHS